MNLLPNHNLAGFLEKQLFAEKRLVFVDQKDEEEIAKMMENERGEKSPEIEKPIDDALKKIGNETRKLVDGIDEEGNFGITGVSQKEVVAENADMGIEDLLREKSDYDEMLDGVEMRKEDFENEIGYALLGGKNGESIRTYPELVDQVSKKYSFLQDIRAGVAGQSKYTETINESILLYREEIEAERDEYLNALKQERQRVLEKIELKLQMGKDDLEQNVTELKSVCKEPEALKEELEIRDATGKLKDVEEVGFFADLEKRTKLEALSQKIREGKFSDAEVLEMSEQIEFAKTKVESRYRAITELADLYNDPEAKQEWAQEILKNVKNVLAYYRQEGSEEVDSTKKPQNPAEERIVNTILDFEHKLQNPNLPVHDLAAIEDFLSKFNEKLKTLRANHSVFENLKKLEAEFAEQSYAEVQNILQAEIQAGLDSPTFFDAEARKLQNHLKTNFQTTQSELTEANLVQYAYTQNIPKAQITDETRKSWLLSKLDAVRRFNSNLNKATSSGQKNLAMTREKMELDGYLADLANPDKNPVEVVQKLEEKGNLEIIPAATFQRKFKDTGITNSYFVIEATEYQGVFTKYQKQLSEWKIYLDQAFYDKIQKGEATENETKRFRARIGHELGHREFDAFKGQEFKASGIYEKSGWSEIKTAFLSLNPEKKIGENGIAVDFTDEEILNEIWALYKEHTVTPLKGKYGEFIRGFENFYLDSFAVKKQIKLRGTEAGTEEEMPAEEGGENQESGEMAVGDKQLQERDFFKGDFERLKKLIENFGGALPEGHEGEEKTSDEKTKNKLAAKFNKVYPEGQKILQKFIEERLPGLQNIYDKIDSSDRGEVRRAQEQVSHVMKIFDNVNENIEKSEEQSQGGYFKDLWDNTRFLSFDDLSQMVKETWEFAQRRRKRRADDGRATVGAKVFGDTLLGNEYFSKQQKIEMDEVGNYQGNLGNMGHEQIYPLLYAPKNKDHLKAVITELCKRGRMRWDDHRIWDSIEHFSATRIPDRERADDDIAYRNGWLKRIATGIWDENTWDDWIKTDASGLSSSCSNFARELNDLHSEGMGAVVKELDKILDSYKSNGIENFSKKKNDAVFFPDHRYMKLVDIAFADGKLNMEAKFYYLIEGVANRVMPIEYLRKIYNDDLQYLPLLDFFYAQNNTYSAIKRLSDQIAADGGYPNGVHKLLMKEVMTNKKVLTRSLKRMSTEAAKIDHDDWQCIFAMSTATMAEKLLTRQGGGNSLIKSDESVRSAYASVPAFLKAQAGIIEDGKEPQYNLVANAISAFVMFDGISMQRYVTAGKHYDKLSPESLTYKPQGGPATIADYQKSMYEFVTEILKRYEGDAGQQYAKSIFTDTTKMNGEEITQKRDAGMRNDVDNFDKKFLQIASDPRGMQIIKEVLQEKSQTLSTYMDQGKSFNFQSGSNNRGDK